MRRSAWFILLGVEENKIGTKIITRSLSNEFESEDITERYKNPPKPSEDRETLNSRLNSDVNFEILVSEENHVSGISARSRFFFEILILVWRSCYIRLECT
jgi:hypothetical protein